MSPNFGTGEVHCQGNLDADGKVPLLSDSEKKLCNGEEQHGGSQSRLSFIENVSLHAASVGELPISRDCSFMQTVLNGKILFKVLIL